MPGLQVLELRAAPQFAAGVAGWLHREWYARRGTRPEELLAGDPAVVGGPARFVACMPGGPAVGTFTLEPGEDPRSGRPLSCLSNVYVDEAWRGMGIGRQLCEAALEHARALGIPRLSLFTASHGTWYAEQGWSYVELMSLRIGGQDVPAILMNRAV